MISVAGLLSKALMSDDHAVVARVRVPGRDGEKGELVFVLQIVEYTVDGVTEMLIGGLEGPPPGTKLN